MSKKKAVDCNVYYLHWNNPNYVGIDFIDKRGRKLLSSVDVALNVNYISNGNNELDEDTLRKFVISR